jgi:transcriptional regulator with XRE-family HTH domain
MPSSFGALLRQYRRTAGLTQRALAEKARLDFSYISKLENNKIPPPAADTIILLCSILGVPADNLLALAGKLPSEIEDTIGASASAQAFLREAQALTDQQWRQLSSRLSQIDPRSRRNILPIYANAYDLAQWAGRFDSFGLLPELVHRLVRATVKDIISFSMSSKEGTRIGGYDGILETEHGNEFVPAGLSVWEMGVNADPKQKADKDYKKRTDNPLHIQPSDAIFIFVTPRQWPGKASWVAEKRQEGKWRDVRALDADDLEAWLIDAPVVHAWISRLIGKDPGNVQDLTSFWDDWRRATEPPLSPKLLLAGRERAAEQLTQQLQAPASTLAVRADAPEEALAYIAAVFNLLPEAERQALFVRTIIVSSADAWSQIILTLQPLILIPMFTPVEPVSATRRGHHVLVPVGPETAETSGMIVLPRLARRPVETELLEMGVNQNEAADLASLAHRSLVALRRRLAVSPALQQPAWAERRQARARLPALLAGRWDARSEGDKTALAALAGRSYEDVEVDLIGYTLVSDPPIRRVGTVWFLTSREDAWQLLARLLTQKDWERFRLTAVTVLATLDPALKLPIEDRWLAGVKNAARPHSDLLREGLAEMLAIMATQPVPDMAGGGSSDRLADVIVKQLLLQANSDQSGEIWLSIADILPSLAEAAPETFLDALEIATKEPDPVIRQLFIDQSSNWFSAQSPRVHLLWALEQLAWSKNYMSRAALYLARLVRLEPQGGRSADRPGSSLRSIFVPWCPQTAATFEDRLHVLDFLRKHEPAASWQLMLALLPSLHDTVDPNSAPRWHDNWKPEEATTFTYAELWLAADAILVRLLEDAKMDLGRICEIEERLENLPPDLREKMYQHLESLDPSVFEINDRERLCKQIRKQIADHRRFSHAEWAMPNEDIERLRGIYEHFEPEDLIRQVAPLFTGVPHLLDAPHLTADLDREKQNDAAYQAQVAAARSVYEEQGLPGLWALGEVAEKAAVLGYVLGRSGAAETEEVLILQELDSSDQKRRSIAEAYVEARFFIKGWEWVDRQLATNSFLSTPAHRANFFLNLPRQAETWNRLEQWDEETKSLYWSQVYSLVREPGDCLRAAEQLQVYGRVWDALELVAHYLKIVRPGADFVLKLLETALTIPLPTPPNQALFYEIPQLLTYLEQDAEVDETRLAVVEWKLMPLLGYELHPLKTLYRQLATDPQFFVELVSLVYRASDEAPSQLSAQQKALAEIAHRLLRSANVVPGMQDTGQVDPTRLQAWLEEVRQTLTERKRETVGDHAIGQLLSHASSGSDGIWPLEVIRDLLEEIRSEDIEQAMILGIYNARGVTWRGVLDGGDQERRLAEQYRSQAQTMQVQWPRTASMLRKLAQMYEEEARLHDRESDLRQSGW